MKKTKDELTRKDFIKKTAGAVAFGIIGDKTFAQTSNFDNQNKKSLPTVALGNSAINVSCIGYGAARSQEPALVRAVLDKGINFFDTGRSYSNGKNEEMLGKLLKGIRQNVVIQSKTRYKLFETGDWVTNKDKVKQIQPMLQISLEESLQALQTDYIDILLFHYATSKEILFHEEVLRFFEKAKKSGKIRAFGFSTHSNELEILETAVKQKFYEIVMVPYNHRGSYVHSVSGVFKKWNQPALENLLKKLKKNNVGVIAMKTCSAGAIKLNGSEPPSFKNSIKWVLNKDFIDCAAVAMLNFDEINENLI